VFFGSNVARSVVERVKSHVARSTAILAIGTSLEVYSVFRFVHQAEQARKLIAILNIGATRADTVAQFKWEANVSNALNAVWQRMSTSSSGVTDFLKNSSTQAKQTTERLH
jgi:NAD-dependent SIR2 family protein deacetylase